MNIALINTSLLPEMLTFLFSEKEEQWLNAETLDDK